MGRGAPLLSPQGSSLHAVDALPKVVVKVYLKSGQFVVVLFFFVRPSAIFPWSGLSILTHTPGSTKHLALSPAWCIPLTQFEMMKLCLEIRLNVRRGLPTSISLSFCSELLIYFSVPLL